MIGLSTNRSGLPVLSALSTNRSGLPVLARLGRRPIGAGWIFSYLSAEKLVGGRGGGVCITHAPHHRYRILIKNKQEGVRIRVKLRDRSRVISDPWFSVISQTTCSFGESNVGDYYQIKEFFNPLSSGPLAPHPPTSPAALGPIGPSRMDDIHRENTIFIISARSDQI